jgi:hypothetical protein
MNAHHDQSRNSISPLRGFDKGESTLSILDKSATKGGGYHVATTRFRDSGAGVPSHQTILNLPEMKKIDSTLPLLPPNKSRNHPANGLMHQSLAH